MENYVMIPVKESTKERIEECKEIFISHHPEMRKMVISYNKIMIEIIDFYIKTG